PPVVCDLFSTNTHLFYQVCGRIFRKLVGRWQHSRSGTRRSCRGHASPVRAFAGALFCPKPAPFLRPARSYVAILLWDGLVHRDGPVSFRYRTGLFLAVSGLLTALLVLPRAACARTRILSWPDAQ